MNPTTTYHLAPVIALLAWPFVARTGGRRASWTSGLVAALGAIVLVILTTGLLLSRDALAGPALIGPNAGVETGVLTLLAAGIAVALAGPRSRAAHEPITAPGSGDGEEVVTIFGSGGGCPTASAAGEGAQCVSTPASPTE